MVKLVKLPLRQCVILSCLSLLTILSVIVLRAVIYFAIPPDLIHCEDIVEHRPITSDRPVVERFIQALKYETITRAPQVYDRKQIVSFIQFLNKSFPLVHSSPTIKLEVINQLSLLYHIHGSDPTLKPYLLLAHMDVVPAEAEHWHMSPFNGTVEDGFIYGRGTLDLKDVVMRSFYIAIGHDEEGRGLDGARQTAQHLKSIGVTDFEFILDEGPFIYNDVILGTVIIMTIHKLGTDRSVAMIGVTEKGFLNVRLSAKGRVGHSSVPPPETPIVMLSKAISKFNAFTHPNFFGRGLEKDIIESIAPYCSFFYKLLYSNLWLFGPIVAKVLESHPVMNSYVRTSTAVTVFKSGIKDNILPGLAEATVNHRIYPLSSISEVLDFDRDLISDDSIDVQVLGVGIEPHPISPYDETSFGYQTIKKSIRQVFPSVAIIPGVMQAATDTRWFLNFTQSIYRFSPAFVALTDLNRIHGHDERISVDNYLKLINFYHHVIISANERSLEPKIVKDEL